MTTPPTTNGDRPEEGGTGGPTPPTTNGQGEGSDRDRMGGDPPIDE